MGRRWLGRFLLLLVVSLGLATLAAPPSAPAQARVVPPPMLLTPAPVSTAPAAPCVRRPLWRCRRVRRLVASAGALRPRRGVWECRAVSCPMPGWIYVRTSWKATKLGALP
jgi:hypothetical protein